jgi:large subunit ribosomal protein L29
MRDLKPDKAREMSEQEIEEKIRLLREELFNLRFRNSMRQLDNPLTIREVRRGIASLTTVLHEHRKGIRLLKGHAEAQEASS